MEANERVTDQIEAFNGPEEVGDKKLMGHTVLGDIELDIHQYLFILLAERDGTINTLSSGSLPKRLAARTLREIADALDQQADALGEPSWDELRKDLIPND